MLSAMGSHSAAQLMAGGTALSMFDAWDHMTGQPPTIAGLIRSLAEDEDYVERIEARVGSESQTPIMAEMTSLVGVYKECVAARKHMVNSFVEAPEDYLLPHRYLGAVDGWTQPPIKVECASGIAIGVTRESGYYVHVAVPMPDGSEAATSFGPPWSLRGVPQIQRENAFKLYTYFTCADILFGPARADVTDTDLFLAAGLFGHQIKLEPLLIETWVY